MNDLPPDTLLGRTGAKIDGAERITGRARFVADMTLPGMLHAKFLRSPRAHAWIRSIDVSAALALPGVCGVMLGEELPEKFGAIPVCQDETALAISKVRYIGEPIACVAAVDAETAWRACRLIRVEYEPIPEVFSIEDALDPAKPFIHHDARKPSNVLRRVHQSYGDVDKGFSEAAHIVERTFRYPGSTHVPLETHAALADWDPHGRLTLWTSTQNPHYVHRDVAAVLGVPEANVRLIKPAVGAGYGGKCDPFCTELCASHLARKLGRPVRIVLEREEVFYTHRGRHPVKMWMRLGMRQDGSISAIDFKAWADGGAYSSYGVVTSYYLGVFMTMPYRLENYRFESQRLYTNKPPCGPKRGHGAIQPRFALELALDEAACALGLDPVAVRLAQCVDPGTETVNGLKITSVGAKECIRQVVEASGYYDKKGKLPPGRGIGLAVSAYMCGALHPTYATELFHSAVMIKIDRSGDVCVFSGTADIGQGSTHMLALLTAERLGLQPIQVRVVEGDTSLTPVDLGSYSSRVTFMAGNACLDAVDRARARLIAAAVAKLSLPPESLDLRDGRVFCVEQPSKSISFIEAVRLAEESGGPLVVCGSYKPPKIGNRFRRQSVGPSPAYSFTAQVAEVDVDIETGIIQVKDIWVAHDCGRVLNRTIAEGQVEGCVYMGVGEALYEEQTYRRGLMRTPSILEYKIPTIHETPTIHTALIESIDPGGPFGAKEVGEGPQLSTVPAIALAIHDATGLRLTDAPFTPDKLAGGQVPPASAGR